MLKMYVYEMNLKLLIHDDSRISRGLLCENVSEFWKMDTCKQLL